MFIRVLPRGARVTLEIRAQVKMLLTLANIATLSSYIRL